MQRKFLVYLGAVCLFLFIGVITSDDFLSHYTHTFIQEQRAQVGEFVSPLELHAVAPEHLSLITEPDDGIAPILSRIQQAQKSIDLVIYKMSDAQIEQALGDAVARGVAVRVLLNGGYYNQKEQSNDSVYARLQQLHVPVRWTPTNFALTHQKTFIFDGTEAVIMTLNLQSKYYATGRDFAVVATNPNDVAAIQAVFDADWAPQNALTGIAGQNPPAGDDLVWSPGAEDELLYLINSATSSLKIYNEVMSDQDIIDALTAAAKRGVEVQVLMTYATNWKPAFTKLVGEGVRVRTYASSSKVRYIHTKMIMVDGTTAFVGSQNFSENSLNKNRELGIVLTAGPVIAGLAQVFDSDWAGARPFVLNQ